MEAVPYEVLEFGQVQVQIQVRPVTGDGLKAFLDAQARDIKQTLAQVKGTPVQKSVVIIDASVSLMPPADARKVQAAWLDENQHLLQLATHGIGLVLPNPLLRGFMASVLALTSQPVAMKTHSSLENAVDWAIQSVQEIHGEISTELLQDGAGAVQRAKAHLLVS